MVYWSGGLADKCYHGDQQRTNSYFVFMLHRCIGTVPLKQIQHNTPIPCARIFVEQADFRLGRNFCPATFLLSLCSLRMALTIKTKRLQHLLTTLQFFEEKACQSVLKPYSVHCSEIVLQHYITSQKVAGDFQSILLQYLHYTSLNEYTIGCIIMIVQATNAYHQLYISSFLIQELFYRKNVSLKTFFQVLCKGSLQ